MTERFNAGADQTIYGASGVGPAETPSSLTALGVGQGSGQSANAQERNSMIGFEFPIRWDDISANLGRLNEKKPLEDLVDDLTIRDRDLEDFLNTNIVNGIVAGSNITISRATGVVTIAAATPAWTAWTPTISNGITNATVSNNNSAYTRIGSTVFARINCTATWGTATTPDRVTNMPVEIKPAANATIDRYVMGSGFANAVAILICCTSTVADDVAETVPVDSYPANATVWDIGATVTYEAA